MKYRSNIAAMLILMVAVAGCSATDSDEEVQDSETKTYEEEEVLTTEDAQTEDAEESFEEDPQEEEAQDLQEEAEEEEASFITPVEMIDTEDQFTTRDLDPSYEDRDPVYITLTDSMTETEGVRVDSSSGITVAIEEEGVYVFDGSLGDGQILIDCQDEDAKVQIVLNNVSLTNGDGPCILALNADKVFITMEADSSNTLSDSGEDYAQRDDFDKTIDGVIFADCDLSLGGFGSLKITAGYKNGIVSKKDLKITGGIVSIEAKGKGIDVNDSVRIAGGVLFIEAGDDGIHTDNEEDEGKGYVYIQDGSITISSGDDGIHAATAMLIEGGSIRITQSYEGLEGDSIDILGGDIQICSTDDGINASCGSGSSFGDGMNAEMEFDKDDIAETIETMDEESLQRFLDQTGMSEEELEEWLEDPDMSVLSGFGGMGGQKGPGSFEEGDPNFEPMQDGDEMETLPEDDPEGGPQEGQEPDASMDPSRREEERKQQMPEDDSSPEGQDPSQRDPKEMEEAGLSDDFDPLERSDGRGGGMDMLSDIAYIRISGGTIYVDASGDGLDSNGDIYIEGGMIYIDGPTDGADGAVDYGDGDAIGMVSGGTIIAVGSAQMAENFDENSTQYVLMINFEEGVSAGEELLLLDADGDLVLSYTPSKEYESVIISSPKLETGTYTLSAGEMSQTFEIEEMITEVGSMMMGGDQNGPGGRPGGGGR